MVRTIHIFNGGNGIQRSKVEILCDQLLDSFIVGAIAGVSTYITAGADASLKTAVLAGALTFLIKFKEYRKIG